MKRTTLIELLETVSNFSIKEKSLIYEHSRSHRVEKGEFLLSYDEICTDMHFVVSGVIRFYILNKNGEEVTTTFICEGEVATRIESFLRGVPSRGYMVCETPCELVTITKTSWDLLCEKSKNFGLSMGQLAVVYVSKKMDMQRRLLTEDAQSSYLKFIETHKNVADQVPMKHIASYLGITPSSLSRIRKEITGK